MIDVWYHIAEIYRRMENMIKSGVVKEFDAAGNPSVDYGDMTTHPLPVLHNSGAGADFRPMKQGQQVTVFNPNGDLARGVAIPGGYDNNNRAPAQGQDADIIGQRGKYGFKTTDQSVALLADGGTLSISGGVATLKADKIILDGVVYLGGEAGAKPIGVRGSIDTSGDLLTGEMAARAYAI